MPIRENSRTPYKENISEKEFCGRMRNLISLLRNTSERISLAGVEVGEIPSPTFTLAQTYEMPPGDIWHFDLFRLEHPDETLELGIEDALNGGICLVEWPDRLPESLPGERLDMAFTFGATEDERRVEVIGDTTWPERLAGLVGNE